MKTITVDINGREYRGRQMSYEDNWEMAANRAIQKCFGRYAAVWRWTLDSRQVDRAGRVVRVGWKGTVVGRNQRHGGGNPILAEATIWMDTP